MQNGRGSMQGATRNIPSFSLYMYMCICKYTIYRYTILSACTGTLSIENGSGWTRLNATALSTGLAAFVAHNAVARKCATCYGAGYYPCEGCKGRGKVRTVHILCLMQQGGSGDVRIHDQLTHPAGRRLFQRRLSVFPVLGMRRSRPNPL